MAFPTFTALNDTDFFALTKDERAVFMNDWSKFAAKMTEYFLQRTFDQANAWVDVGALDDMEDCLCLLQRLREVF